MDREAWQAIVHGAARAGHNSVTKLPDFLQSKTMSVITLPHS